MFDEWQDRAESMDCEKLSRKYYGDTCQIAAATVIASDVYVLLCTSWSPLHSLSREVLQTIPQGAYVMIPTSQMIEVRFKRVRDHLMVNNQEVLESEHKAKFSQKNSVGAWGNLQYLRDNGAPSWFYVWLTKSKKQNQKTHKTKPSNLHVTIVLSAMPGRTFTWNLRYLVIGFFCYQNVWVVGFI